MSETLRNDFDSRYRAAGGPRHHQILKIIAAQPDRIVALQVIADGLKLAQNQFSSYMGTLLERDALNRPEDGRYEFIDPLFREYVKRLTPNGDH